MSPSRTTLTTALGAVVVTVAVAPLVLSPVAAATEDPVSAERWMRAVCTELSGWIEASAPMDRQIFQTVESLEAGSVSPVNAKKRLVKAATASVKTVDELIDDVRSVGTPRIDDGRQVEKSYIGTLEDYRDVYKDMRVALARADVSSREALVDGVVEAQDSFVASFGVVGFDPLEELRDVPELAGAIDSQAACRQLEASLRPPPAPVAAGDCIATVGDYLYELSPVGCDGPHEGETLVVADHGTPLGEPFPGNDALENFVGDTCLPAFADFVGIDFDASELDFRYWTPTAETWVLGDREVVCVIVDPSGARLVGSVEGTAR